MIVRLSKFILSSVAVLLISAGCVHEKPMTGPWQKEFKISDCKLLTTGGNQYFPMKPGFQTVLRDGETKLQITVLNETKKVAGVTTRVIEEREWKNGKLFEVSRNYFAMCEGTKDVFYFGEDVDFYENGKVVKHDGAWLAGKDGNTAGLIMAGTPKIGMKYYQEIAPGVALDRAEVTQLEGVCETPAGKFTKCLKTKEGSALEPWVTEYKYYAPNIGLIRDGDVVLVKYGTVKKK